MPDTFTQFTVKRGSDGTTFPDTVGNAAANGPYTVDDTTDPASSPTGKWFYTVDETTNGGVTVPYNTVMINSVKQGTCQKVWQISPSGQGNDCKVFGLKGDSAGNMVATGFMRGTANFGGADQHGHGQASDIFLVKYDSNNQITFYNQYGNGNNNQANSVAVDSGGNSIITGTFSSSAINLGGADLQPVPLSQFASFAAKYSPSGVHVWSVVLTTGSGSSVTVDSSGNVYVFVQDLYANLVIKKLSVTNGSEIWSQTIGTGNAFGIALTPDQGTVLVTSSVSLMAFSAADGTPIASPAKTFPGCVLRGICVHPNGNIVLTGSAARNASVGGPAAFGDSAFLSGYHPNGDFLWQYFIGGSVLDTGTAVTINSGGYLVFTGGAQSSYFGPGTDPLLGNGAVNYFASGFTMVGDSKPTWRWSKLSGQPNATGTSAGQSVGIDTAGRVFTGGWFNQIADFGDGFLGHASSLQAAGFLAQYSA